MASSSKKSTTIVNQYQYTDPLMVEVQDGYSRTDLQELYYTDHHCSDLCILYLAENTTPTKVCSVYSLQSLLYYV